MRAAHNATPRLDRRSQELEGALLEFIARAPAGFERYGADRADSYGIDGDRLADLDATFERLALELFVYQFERVPVYRAWTRAHGLAPGTVRRALSVPALPVEAWREARVATFTASAERAVFETSGTTSVQKGVLRLDSLALYEASLERGFTHHVMPDCAEIRMLLFVPEPHAAPRSSLGHMLHHVRRRFGSASSTTCMRDGQLDWPRARRQLEACRLAGEPVALLGTAFAFVQLLDACDTEHWSIELPEGSRLFETGGYKGRTRELSRAHLYASLERRLGIPGTHMVSEYGMTELASQYYTLTLRRSLLAGSDAPTAATIASHGAPGSHDDSWSAPFWLRASIVDSGTGFCEAPQDAQAAGLLAHHDLANRGSVAHVLCADIGQPQAASFALRGRASNADRRGCGLAAEPASPGRQSNPTDHAAQGSGTGTGGVSS